MLFSVKKNIKWIFLLFIVISLSSCAGGGADDETSTSQTAIVKIANYAESAASAPTLQDYIDAGIEGVNANNIQQLNEIIAALTYSDVDTKAEIQSVLNGLASATEDIQKPVITLKGANPTTIIQGETYAEAGATAIDDRDGAVDVVITGTVNSEIIASYFITYTARDEAGNIAIEKRVVLVVAKTTPDKTPPVISLNGENPLSLAKGTEYTEAGASAVDDRDGSVTVTISGNVDTNVVASYTITYSAEDKAKNKATKTRTVVVQEPACDQVITHAYNPNTGEEKDYATPCDVPEGWIAGTPPVEDTIAPIITRVGEATINLNVGDAYVDAGATAQDNIDGDITNNIVISNPVNTAVANTYTVTYNVDDAAGNHAQEVTRSVTVNPVANRVYGADGGNAIAAPIVESVNGNSVIIMPEGTTSADPIPVVFVAPGWKNTDYTRYQTLLNFIASHGYAVIYAKDFSGMSADGMLTHFRDMASNPAITPLLDTSRFGVIGHSSGGGHAFRILRDFSDNNNEGWGENGRFLLALEPWFAFTMTEADMKSLPANTRVVIQQYGEGGNNADNDTDARIPLTEYYLLDSIVDSQKDYQIVVNADHSYPYETGAYSEIQGILKPLDGLMELTFQTTPDAGAQEAALELGNDNPYDEGHGIQLVKLINEYHYKCHGSDTIINYCKIYQGAFPPESVFNSIDTNTENAKPALKGKYVDLEFGREVSRVTDRISQNDDPKVNADGDKIARGNAHPYAKTQAWNNDMTMIRLNYRIYDAHTLDEVPLKKMKSDGTYTVLTTDTDSLSDLYSINGSLNEKKWSNINPNVFYGVYNGSGNYNGNFWKGTINRASNTIHYDLVKSFASNDYTFDRFTLGKYEGNIDFSDHYVAFAARKTGQKYLTAIVYDIQNDNVIETKEFPNIAWPDQGQVFDWLTISPLGNYVLFSTGNGVHKYDRNLNYLGQLAVTGGHGDIGVDVDGVEAYVQYEYGDNRGIWIYRLSDGQRVRLLPDKYNGGHISCRNYNNRGWCYASTTAPGFKDIVAIKLDYTGPDNHVVRRFVQTQTSQTALSNVNASPDGRQVLFDSDWRDNTVHWSEKDTYIVK